MIAEQKKKEELERLRQEEECKRKRLERVSRIKAICDDIGIEVEASDDETYDLLKKQWTVIEGVKKNKTQLEKEKADFIASNTKDQESLRAQIKAKQNELAQETKKRDQLLETLAKEETNVQTAEAELTALKDVIREKMETHIASFFQDKHVQKEREKTVVELQKETQDNIKKIEDLDEVIGSN